MPNWGNFLALFFLTVCSGLWLPVNAGHIAGGNVSYECLGGDEYRVTLSIFRNCSESPMGNTQFIKFNSDCGNFFSILATQVNTQEVSQLCPSALANSSCSGGIWPGMEIYQYELEINLPPCDSWEIYWENCTRAVSNNVDDSLFPCYRINALLNNVVAPCNNSPVVTQQTIPYVCVNQQVNYNPGVIETDGDSLRYYLVSGLTWGGAPIVYEPGFSGLLPVPGITIGNNTGQISFTATATGTFTIVIEVEEYNTAGDLIGTIRHDILFVVENCPQPVPQPNENGFTNLVGSAILSDYNVIEACGGDSFCADISFSSVNPISIITLTSNIDAVLPGATLNITGTNPAVGQVCWTAPPGFSNTFQVNINAQDDACPIFGIATWSFIVTPIMSINAGPNQLICEGESVTLDVAGDTQYIWDVFSGEPISVGNNFSCIDCPNPTASPSVTTTYLVTGLTSTTGCVNTDTVTVAIALDEVNALVSSETCFLNDATILLQVVNGSGNYSYLWESGDTTQYQFNIPAGDYNVFIEDLTLGCSVNTTVDVAFPPFPDTYAGPDVIFCGTVYDMQAESNAGYGYWLFPAMADAVFFPDVYTHNAQVVISNSGTWDFIWFEDDGNNCTNQDTVTITVTVPPNIEAGPNNSVCGSSYALEAIMPPIGTPFWTGPPGSVFYPDEFDPNATVTVSDYGLHYFSWTLDLGFQCGGTDSVAVYFSEPIIADAGPTDSICGDSYLLQPVIDGLNSYWSLPGSSLFLSPGIAEPDTIVTADNYGTYNLIWTIEDFYCTDSDTLSLTFIEPPNANAGPDTSVCGLTFVLTAQPSVGNGFWQGLPGTVFDPDNTAPNASVTVADYGVFEFVWVEDNGFICQDSDTISVLFVEMPVANAGVDFTTCGLSYDFATVGMGAVPSVGNGLWSAEPGVVFDDATNPTTSVIVPSEGIYTITWTEDNGSGCVSSNTREATFWSIPEPDAGTDFEVCGLTASLSGQLNVGIPVWSGPGSATYAPDFTSLMTNVTVVDYGTWEFELTGDNNGCTSVSSTSVTFIENPIADAGPDGAVCELEYTLQAIPSVGSGEWLVQTGFTLINATDPATNVNATSYGMASFTWIETNASCSDTAEVTIEFVETPIASPGADQVVCGLNADLTAVPSVGSGLWYSNSGAIITETGPGTADVVAPSTGEIEFWWIENNGYGCMDSALVTIDFVAIPVANAGVNDSICGLQSLIAALPSVGTGMWSANPNLVFDDAASASTFVTAPSYGSYTLTWTEDNGSGCTDADDITLVFSEVPVPDAGMDQVVCGLEADLFAIPSIGEGEWSGLDVSFNDISSPNAVISALNFGSYVLTWTESNGNCAASALVEVEFVETPLADAGMDDAVCGLEYTLQATPTTGNGYWSVPPGVTISNNLLPDAQITAGSSGTYNLYWVESIANCTDSASVGLTFVDEPLAYAGEDESVCGPVYILQGESNLGTGNWTATPPLDFVDSSQPNTQVSANTYGVYTLIWEVGNGFDCTDSDTLELTFVEAPVAQAGDDFEICGLSANLSAIPSGGSGSWTGAAGVLFSDPTDPATELSVPDYGTYLFTWTESTAFGCNTFDEIEVVFWEQPNANPGVDTVVCGLEFELEAIPSAGQGVWSEISGNLTFTPTANEPNATVNASLSGDYALTWTETNGVCSSFGTIDVTFIDQPVADAGADGEICGLSYSLSASGGNGQWTGPPGISFSPSDNDPNAVVSASGYGSHTLIWTIDNGNGCVHSDELTIVFLDSPQATAVSVTCIDGNINYLVSFTLSGGDASSYSVTGDPGTLIGDVFLSDPITNGATYSFQVSDGNNCQVVNVSGSNVCPNLTYAGTMNQAPIEICGNGPVTAIHNSDNTLDGNDAMIFILHSNPSLPLGTVWAQGATPSFSFQPGMEFGVTYYVSSVVGNDNGLGGVDFSDPLLSVSSGTPITFYEVPTAQLSGGGSVCVGDTIWANVQFSGSPPFQFTYAISGSVQPPIITNETEISIPLTNTGQVQPIQLNNAFCLGTTSGVVNGQFAPLPQAEISGGGTVCTGNSEIVVVELNGIGPFEFIYALDALPQPPVLTSQTTYTFEAADAGVYTLVYMEDQLCEGETSGEAELEVIPYPLADPGPDLEMCYGEEVIVLGGTPQPGNTYQWSNSQFLDDANSPNPEVVYNNDIFVPIPLSFILTVSNDECSSSSSVEVTLFPVPEIQTNEQVQMCEGGAAQLQVSGATDIEWSPNQYISDPNASSAWVYPPSNTTYTVAVSNDYGCTATGSVYVVVNPMPVVQFSASIDSVCAPAAVTLHNQTAGEFLGSCLWNLGNGQILSSCNPNVYGYFLDNGSYDVSLTITSPQGCSFTQTQYGFVNILGPEAYFTYSPNPADVTYPHIQFQNQTTGATNFMWDFGLLGSSFNINPMVDFPHQAPDDYEVCLTAIDENGCMDEYCTVVEIEADILIYVPNAFSPNGDGINDLFFPVMQGVDIVEYEFMIFNRRGKLVWQTFDPEAKWNGEDLTREYYDDNQVYIWKLRIKDRYSTLREDQNGTVMVIR